MNRGNVHGLSVSVDALPDKHFSLLLIPGDEKSLPIPFETLIQLKFPANESERRTTVRAVRDL